LSERSLSVENRYF